MSKAPFYFLGLCLIVAIIAINLQSHAPTGKIPTSDTTFSLQRAYDHLANIAAAPHSIGTLEHEKVMNYIIAACRDAGLSTQVQRATVVKQGGSNVMAAEVNNIIAVKKGLDSSRAVLIMAHYDSEQNTFGAADDGAAVAAMLETARILRVSGQLKNDIIFLFTDGEERGLMGAKAFVEASPLMKRLGLVLNFEARGNTGIPTMFEVNPGNGWIVKEYINGAVYPFANSLSFEIYKRLPNDTDFSLFKAAGIAGLNTAFIEGYANYHSMTDTRDNLNANTFRVVGQNMLGLVKHFGNIDIQHSREKDISYFNVAGHLMIHYPAAWNSFFMLLTLALLALYIVKSYRAGFIKPGMVFAGAGIFILMTALVCFLSGLFLKSIGMLSPFADRFYSGNSYNSYYYFLSITLLSITLLTLGYGLIIKKFKSRSLATGTLLAEALIMIAFSFLAPSAGYFLSFPLLAVVASNFLVYRVDNETFHSQWKPAAVLALFSLPALLIMAPFIYLTFVAFGLGPQLPAAVLLLCLLLGMLLPLIVRATEVRRYLIPVIGAAGFLLAVGMAANKGRFSKQQPFRTDLQYLLNKDSGKAVWVSNFLQTDKWNRQFFANARVQTLYNRYGLHLVNDAPLWPLMASNVTTQRDTIENGRRQLSLFIKPSGDVACLRMMVADDKPVSKVSINGKELRFDRDMFRRLVFFNPGQSGVTIQFELDPALQFGISVTDQRIGVPSVEKYKALPESMIQGLMSNTTEITKSYAF